MADDQETSDYGVSWKRALVPPKWRSYSGKDVGDQSHFTVFGNKAERINFFVENSDSMKMACTLFQVETVQKDCCVVYAHSLQGNRMEALSIQSTIEQEFDICCFDFIGTGQSEGNLSTFGVREAEDLKSLLDSLRNQLNYKTFVLWGRCVGGVAIINYLAKYKSAHIIEAVVLDSPFAETKEFMDALVSADDSNSMVPGFMISIALSLIASDIGFQRNCTVLENDPEKLLAQIEVPLIYFAARSDTLCKLPKARRMFDGYSVERKKFIDFEGTHNSVRNPFILEEALDFILMSININHGYLELPGKYNSPDPAPHKYIQKETPHQITALSFPMSPHRTFIHHHQRQSICIVDFPDSPPIESKPSFLHIHTPRRSPYSLTLRRLPLS